MFQGIICSYLLYHKMPFEGGFLTSGTSALSCNDEDRREKTVEEGDKYRTPLQACFGPLFFNALSFRMVSLNIGTDTFYSLALQTLP